MYFSALEWHDGVVMRTTNNVSAIVLTVTLAFGVSSCAPVAPPPPVAPNPTPTANVVTMTPEDAWDSFGEVSRQSCREAYTGLVEEDVVGPNSGQLKIRLTFEQAGENSLAIVSPQGDADIDINHFEFYACEVQGYLVTLDNVQFDSMGDAIYPYEPGLALEVTYNSADGSYSTVRQLEDGSIRRLEYTVTNGLFTRVANLDDGSETTLTYGEPDSNLTAIVNDAYDAYFSN